MGQAVPALFLLVVVAIAIGEFRFHFENCMGNRLDASPQNHPIDSIIFFYSSLWPEALGASPTARPGLDGQT
jgi:hypothetical protein